MIRNVVLAISGGVDSAVTGLLLKNKGYNVTAVFMKNWDIIDETGNCTIEADYEDAQWVCNKLKIPLVQINFVKDYWNNVFSTFIDSYESGSTPNPDILCNKHIKFNKFFHLVREEFKADAIATGHYVKSSFGPYLEHFKPNTNAKLLCAQDLDKDQTFFMCQVPQETLRYCMFPLGDYFKRDVKKIAMDAGLTPIVQKRESMGICFIGRRQFQSFISQYIEEKPGDFIDLDSGQTIGRHDGVHYWTIGQRCKIPGCTEAYFVYRKDVATHAIIVVQGTCHPALYTDLIVTENPHWLNNEPCELQGSTSVLNCSFRFQHRHPLIDCKVYKMHNNQLIIQLSRPTRAITKGQYAVLYCGQECLGGSRIVYPGPSYFCLNKAPRNVDGENDELVMSASACHF